jgi:hypothetical protein
MSGENREITGFERMLFTKEWLKRGKPGDRVEFIKKCCEHLGITYTSPPEYDIRRNVIVSKEADMFPVKKEDR